jgi:hypothetical protein
MRNKFLMIVSFLAAILFLNSCLKDNVGIDWTKDLKGKMYAEVWKGGFAAQGLAPVPDSVVFKFLVNIATDALPTSDITLTIGVNDDARVRYNAANKTAYMLYPYIEVLDPTVVIKAGTRNAYVHVRVWNAQLLNACDNYMAPISILTATGGVIVSDAINNGSRLMALPISNPFAGTYHVTGHFIHPTAGTRIINEDKVLTTVDCKTVNTSIGDLGGNGLYITINADNSVTIGGQQSDTQPLVQDNTKPNVYDPVAKTITLNYYYVGAGGNRVMDELYTRLN